MATRSVPLTNPKFPPGTVVSIFPRLARIHGGKPSGEAIGTATVSAAGVLALNQPGAIFQLWAEVGGEHRTVQAGNILYTPPKPTLRERVARSRALQPRC